MLFTNNYGPSRSSHLVPSKFVLAKSYQNDSKHAVLDLYKVHSRGKTHTSLQSGPRLEIGLLLNSRAVRVLSRELPGSTFARSLCTQLP